MTDIKIYNDTEECKRLWNKLWPVNCLFDLWPIRSCFHNSFNRPLSFHVFEKNGVPRGMIALCKIEKENIFGHFPGETWKGKTWLEQNKIIADRPETALELLSSIPCNTHIRYLNHDSYFLTRGFINEDETGYLFFPKKYHYSFHTYLQEFSSRSRKKLNAEISKLEARNATIQHNRLIDADHFFKMNIDAFGKDSYFSDPQFLTAFEKLISFLEKTGMLRITTILIDKKIAAVDIGAIWKKTYTLLAGGTNPEFPGVAKMINLHHINWACSQKLELVDFLCGDFNWKKRFHLTPRPLYELKTHPLLDLEIMHQENRKICA